MNEVHQGGCLCGSIRYRASGEPARSQICHCRYCQTRTGSAFAIVVAFREEQIAWSGPELTVYEHRSDESGRWIRNHFCSRCATTVMLSIERDPRLHIIAGGTFDDPNWFAIDRHIWTRSAQHWMHIPEVAAKFEKAFVP